MRLANVLADTALPRRARRATAPRRGRPVKPSPFLEAFLDKGRMRPLLENIPIAICTEPLAGLLGAAAHAAKQAAAASAAKASARSAVKAPAPRRRTRG